MMKFIGGGAGCLTMLNYCVFFLNVVSKDQKLGKRFWKLSQWT